MNNGVPHKFMMENIEESGFSHSAPVTQAPSENKNSAEFKKNEDQNYPFQAKIMTTAKLHHVYELSVGGDNLDATIDQIIAGAERLNAYCHEKNSAMMY